MSAEPWETQLLSSKWNSVDLSCNVRVDPPWDHTVIIITAKLVEIARGKFKEAEGARKWPDAIEYLSVHCDISPLILGTPSEAQVEKVPARGFLRTANTNWNS